MLRSTVIALPNSTSSTDCTDLRSACLAEGDSVRVSRDPAASAIPASRSRISTCSSENADGQFENTSRMPMLRSEEHTSELQSLTNLVCRLLLEKKKKKKINQ